MRTYSILIAGLLVAQVAGAQAAQIDARTLDSLRSPAPMTRLYAFQGLERRGLLSARLGPELLALARLENAVWFGPVYLGEGWSEYYSAVRGACSRYCDLSDPEVLRTLVDGAYNHDSQFAIWIAREHGRRILSQLVEHAHSSLAHRRVSGVYMLGQVAELAKGLTPADRDAVHREALRAAADSNAAIRHAGINALGAVGVAADLPLLRLIAASDPRVTKPSGRAPWYPLRDEAERSIQRINARQSP